MSAETAPSSKPETPEPSDLAGEATPTPATDGSVEPTLTTGMDAASETSAASEPGTSDGQSDGQSDASTEAQKPKRRRRTRKPRAARAEGARTEGDSNHEGEPKRQGKPRPAGQAKSHGKDHRHASERVPFSVGEEVFGKVTAVLERAIMLDLSGKALAVFDRGEMEADDLVPDVGDRFLARVHQDGSRGGLVVVTRKPLREEDSKPRVEKAAKDGELIRGLVTGVIKGGVDVDIDGLRAFAPASGVDLHPQNANLATLVGLRLEFRVSQYENQGREVVVTRRSMLESEARDRRKKALEVLTEGQVLKGTVRTVVDWGAFVALPEAEHLEGLIHATEASHDPRARIFDLFKIGDTVDVKIVKIDERGKIWLSRKALLEDPWAEARERYQIGNKLKAVINRVESFGAFVALEQGIEGFIHVSDLAFKRVEHPKELLKEGQEFEVVVHELDLRNRKVLLHPALPNEEPPQTLARNTAVDVVVTKAESAGLQVRVLGVTGRGARGFIPAGQTGTERGTDLRQRFKLGMRLRAKVIELDPRRGEPKLSIRQLADEEERRAHSDYRKRLAQEGGFGTLGDLLAGKLAR